MNAGKNICLEYMKELLQDADMNYVKNYYRPNLLITLTQNANLRVIKQEVFDMEKPQNCQDSLARVFHQKHKALIDLIKRKKFLGNVQCDMHTIQSKKR